MQTETTSISDLCRLVPYKRVDLGSGSLQSPGFTSACGGGWSGAFAIGGLGGSQPSPCWAVSPSNRWKQLMSRCRAFVYAGLEDFGIAPVEAMAVWRTGDWVGARWFAWTRCVVRRLGMLLNPLGFSSHGAIALSRWCKPWSGLNKPRIWPSLDAEAIRAWAERFRPEAFAARFEAALRTSLERFTNGAVPLQRVTLRRCQGSTCDVECGETQVEPLTSAFRPSLIQTAGRAARRGKYRPHLALISAPPSVLSTGTLIRHQNRWGRVFKRTGDIVFSLECTQHRLSGVVASGWIGEAQFARACVLRPASGRP